MRIEIIKEHKLDKFDFEQFSLGKPDLNKIELKDKLKRRVAFKTTVQKSGTIGGDIIRTGHYITIGPGKQIPEELVVEGVEVATSKTRQYGVILCSLWGDLLAVIISPPYKSGKIQLMNETNNMHRTEILNMPSVNPGMRSLTVQQPLLKFFTAEELDKAARLPDEQLLGIHEAVMNVINKSDVDGDQGKDKTPDTDKPIDTTSKEYREALKAELENQKIIFAKNATTLALIELLRENDPDNALFPKKTPEQLQKELLDGGAGTIDPPKSNVTASPDTEDEDEDEDA